MQAVIKIFFISSFFVVTLHQSNAETFPTNYGMPPPAWASNQAPIAWGDYVPVPIAPMNMPQANMPMGNMPFTPVMPIPMPAPMYATPYETQYRLLPPSPYFNTMPMPGNVATQTLPNCIDDEEKLKALQARYDNAASASSNRIAELKQSLEDAQNQISDSNNVLNKTSVESKAQKDKIAELENQLKMAEEKSSGLQSKLDSALKASTIKNAQGKEAIELLKKELSDSKNINITLKTQLSSAEKNLGSQARMLTSLQQGTAELTAIRSAYKERNDETISLKEQLAKLENEYKMLKAELSKMQNTASLQGEKLTALDQSKAEIQALQSVYKVCNDKNAALKNEIAEVETEKTDMLTMLDSKQTAITLKGAQDSEIIAGLKKKLSASENNIITLETQLDTAINNAGSQARKITALSQNTVELAAIQSAYKERIDENAELKKKLLDLESTQKNLKAQLETATKNTDSQAEKLSMLNQSIAELETLKRAYKERNDENATLKIKQSDMEDMRLTIEASNAKTLELQNKLTDSEEQRKTLLDKIATLETTSSNQASEIASLMVTTSELDEIKSAYKDLSSEQVEVDTQLEAATADTDKDGVANANDLCPASATGTIVNEFGCIPSESMTLKGVTFATGSARLASSSLPIINATAATLKQSPDLNIEVAGYTDNQGLAYVNKRLSKRRANSVMTELINHGVKAERLSANGYGEKDPVASNDTEQGRATNRRVELKIRE